MCLTFLLILVPLKRLDVVCGDHVGILFLAVYAVAIYSAGSSRLWNVRVSRILLYIVMLFMVVDADATAAVGYMYVVSVDAVVTSAAD
jgi:hypothetical protein